MDKFIDHALPVMHIAAVIIVWGARVALILLSLAVWLAFFILWLVLVWFIKGSPPRLVMRYL